MVKIIIMVNYLLVSSELPVFIQVLEPWQNFFVGICESRGVRAEYEMVHLSRVPSHCKHLTGKLVKSYKFHMRVCSCIN